MAKRSKKRRSPKQVAEDRPAETATATVGAGVAALAVILGSPEFAAVVAGIAALPAVVSTLVTKAGL